jgi:hypothetical protein
MDSTPDLHRRRRGELAPLSESSSRHLRLFHGVTLLRLAAESDVSLRKLSLSERGLYKLSHDEERRRRDALDRLRRVPAGTATP